MYINDIFQLNILLLSVGFGFLLAVIYDLLGWIFSWMFGASRSFFVKDIVYCVISTLLVFVFLLAVNFGRVRIFIVLGIAVGFACWFFLIRRPAIKAASKIIGIFSQLFKLAAYVASLPIRPLISLSSKIWLKIRRFFAKKIKKMKNILKMHLKKI